MGVNAEAEFDPWGRLGESAGRWGEMSADSEIFEGESGWPAEARVRKKDDAHSSLEGLSLGFWGKEALGKRWESAAHAVAREGGQKRGQFWNRNPKKHPSSCSTPVGTLAGGEARDVYEATPYIGIRVKRRDARSRGAHGAAPHWLAKIMKKVAPESKNPSNSDLPRLGAQDCRGPRRHQGCPRDLSSRALVSTPRGASGQVRERNREVKARSQRLVWVTCNHDPPVTTEIGSHNDVPLVSICVIFSSRPSRSL